MQILFKGICIDHYPYHIPTLGSKHWNKYNHTFRQREDWSKNLIKDLYPVLKSNYKFLSSIGVVGEIWCTPLNTFSDFLLSTQICDNKLLKLSDIDFNIISTYSKEGFLLFL